MDLSRLENLPAVFTILELLIQNKLRRDSGPSFERVSVHEVGVHCILGWERDVWTDDTFDVAVEDG